MTVVYQLPQPVDSNRITEAVSSSSTVPTASTSSTSTENVSPAITVSGDGTRLSRAPASPPGSQDSNWVASSIRSASNTGRTVKLMSSSFIDATRSRPLPLPLSQPRTPSSISSCASSPPATKAKSGSSRDGLPTTSTWSDCATARPSGSSSTICNSASSPTDHAADSTWSAR